VPLLCSRYSRGVIIMRSRGPDSVTTTVRTRRMRGGARPSWHQQDETPRTRPDGPRSRTLNGLELRPKRPRWIPPSVTPIRVTRPVLNPPPAAHRRPGPRYRADDRAARVLRRHPPADGGAPGPPWIRWRCFIRDTVQGWRPHRRGKGRGADKVHRGSTRRGPPDPPASRSEPLAPETAEARPGPPDVDPAATPTAGPTPTRQDTACRSLVQAGASVSSTYVGAY